MAGVVNTIYTASLYRLSRLFLRSNDVERLKQLLAEYPALLSWKDDEDGSLLGMATGAYGDAGDPQRERWFTRGACAELLIDAGAVVAPSVCEGLIESRARRLLQLFQRKGLPPRTLKFFAALGELDAVRTAFDESGNDLAIINEAFVCACRFDHEAVASLLLERSIALDPELGTQVDGSVGRVAFIKYFIDTRVAHATTGAGPWKAFVMERVGRAAHDGDVAAFVSTLQRGRWLLGEACVHFQIGLIGAATLNDRGEILSALLDLDPAIVRRQPPPASQAIEFAFTYAKTHLLPVLTRIWPLPNDLPHAAGMGNLSRVKQWFDDAGAPALGDIDHYPGSPYMPKERIEEYARQWGAPGQQRVLDVALAWAAINRHFEVADFLLAHGADINTNWNSHEPASILHDLVFLPNPYESMQFLIDRGIDLTIRDYRWDATAQGWARVAANDEKMAQWLEDAERQREPGR